MKEKLSERIRWWIHNPRKELIYLLGGTPNEHIVSETGTGAVHYRNIRAIISNIKKKMQ